VSGVGPIAALAFKATIDDPARFARSRSVVRRVLHRPRAEVECVNKRNLSRLKWVRALKTWLFRVSRFALSTEDVARSVKFYVEQLGFTCPPQLRGFARVRLGAADIMLAQPNAHLPWRGPRFTGSIYLNVDNVDALWESLKARARIAYPIETMEYGVREFGLLDDSGYQLSFAQDVATSVG
jgi:uncharacterized glyoxalase superfamily protein PhnB